MPTPRSISKASRDALTHAGLVWQHTPTSFAASVIAIGCLHALLVAVKTDRCTVKLGCCSLDELYETLERLDALITTVDVGEAHQVVNQWDGISKETPRTNGITFKLYNNSCIVVRLEAFPSAPERLRA